MGQQADFELRMLCGINCLQLQCNSPRPTITFASKGKTQLVSAGFLWRTTPPATTDDSALILLKDNIVPLYLEFIAEYRPLSRLAG